MLKRQSKKLAIMLIFSLIATLFVGVGAASAANAVVSIGRTPTINVDVKSGMDEVLAPMTITEDDDAFDTFANGDYFYVKLPTGIEWQNGGNNPHKSKPNATPPVVVDYAAPSGYVTLERWNASATDWQPVAGGIKTSRSTTTLLYVQINTAMQDNARERIVITPNIMVNGYSESTIEATIQDVDANIPSGSWLVAKTSSGGTVSAASSKPTVGESIQNLGLLRITEVGINTFVQDTEIKLTLPKNVEWNGLSTGDISFKGGFLGTPACSVTILSNKREAVIKITNPGTTPRTSPGIIEVKTPVNLLTKATYGDIELKVEGTGNVTTETVVIGVFADYAVSLSSTDDAVLVSGQMEQEAGVLTIKEAVKGTLTPNRNIEITLPKGVKLADTDNNSAVEVKTRKGSTIAGDPKIEVDKITIPIGNTASTVATTIEVSFKKLNIAPDFKGDIVVQVAGRAGVSGDATIGNVLQALTPSESKSEVKIGFQNQKVGDMVFTEAQAGAVLEGQVLIVAPNGVTFAGKPVVEVTEGNMDLKDNSVRIDNRTGALVFEVDAESTKVSTITISGLVLNIDRTVPVGPITFDVYGEEGSYDYDKLTGALVGDAGGSISESSSLDASKTDPWFDYSLAFSFVGANCVTPASVNVAAVSQFVIGSTTYTVNNEENSMPTAPYIKDNRTYLVLRYSALAMGIPESNILWDATNRTVTLMKDGVVVQMTIGSKIMKVNGADIVLDVAPEISNNYTMLPIGVIANAFNYSADWDAATQTVTINPLEKNTEVAF